MVSAFNPKTFVFLPKESVGDPAKDIITTINIPNVVSNPGSHPVVNGVCPSYPQSVLTRPPSPLLQAVMEKVRDSFFKSIAASVMMKSAGSGIITNRTVNELLWGYLDPLLAVVKKSKPDLEEYFGLMYKVGGTQGPVHIFV